MSRFKSVIHMILYKEDFLVGRVLAMSTFDPNKLSVTFLPPVTPFKPLEERKYTMTHSDTTGELFLTVGYCFDVSCINPTIRDEVIVEWVPQMGQYMLAGKVHVSGGEYDEQYAKLRFMIFKRDLILALTSIVYGDRAFYQFYPWLLDAPIYIQFESNYPEFDQLLYYGTPRHYMVAATKQSLA